MGESLPLATIQQAVLEFLRGRDDSVVFGAQAVNAYVDAPRMTQELDLLSPRAGALVQELLDLLASAVPYSGAGMSVQPGTEISGVSGAEAT